MTFPTSAAAAAFSDDASHDRADRATDDLVAQLIEQARMIAADRGVPAGVVALHLISRALDRLAEHRQLAAGWAVAVAPRSAVAAALGRRSGGNLESSFPELVELRDAFRRRATGETADIEHGSARWPVDMVPREEAWVPRRGRLVLAPDLPVGVGVERGGKIEPLPMPRWASNREAQLSQLGIAILADGTPHWVADAEPDVEATRAQRLLQASDNAAIGVEWLVGRRWTPIPASAELEGVHEQLGAAIEALSAGPREQRDELIEQRNRLVRRRIQLRDKELRALGIELVDGEPQHIRSRY